MKIEVPVLKLEDSRISQGRDMIVQESTLTVYLNGEELVSLLCTPQYQDELAVGFLVLQGLLKHREDLVDVEVDQERGLARVSVRGDALPPGQAVFKRVIASSGARGLSPQLGPHLGSDRLRDAGARYRARSLMALMHRFLGSSELYRHTAGVHSAALATADEMLVFREDIGRHNAIDKIAGHCFLRGLPTSNKVLLTTGRVSSEILTKAARLGVDCLVSRAAPTNVAVAWAEELGLTLVGFARGDRLTVFAHPERLEGLSGA
ncbi:MAG: formate dehydrogenase accessory sulfurtransferase FdhD [Moorellales bacterium]